MFQKQIQFVQNLWRGLEDVWHSLPHQVQAIILIFASGAGPFIWKIYSDPNACWQWSCIKHSLSAALDAGVVSLCAFYMRPGRGRAGGPNWEATDAPHSGS